MQDSLLKILGVAGIVAVLVCLVLAALAMIGAVDLGKGCFMRYDTSGKGGMDAITNTVTLNANANYTSTSTMLPGGSMKITPDPNHYGEWFNTNVSVLKGQKINLQIKGEISLCRAYVPKDNVQWTESTRPGKSNLDDNGQMIPIPRVNEHNALPVSLILDAKNGQWRNIAELYNNDRILVSISSNFKDHNAAITDVFKGSAVTANCAEKQTTYSPICGKYSMYFGQYVDACELKPKYWRGNKRTGCDCSVNAGEKRVNTCSVVCFFGHGPPCCDATTCDLLSAWVNVFSDMPEGYLDDGSFTFKWSSNPGALYIDYATLQCSKNAHIPSNNQCPDVVNDRSPKDKDYIGGAACASGVCRAGEFQKARRFWYTADGGGGGGPTGLIWRLNISGALDNSIGTPVFAKFVANSDQPPEYGDKYTVIYNQPFNGNQAVSYLQYRLWNHHSQNVTQATGGYVLNIKQTKCYRENGNSFSDVFTDRGRVQYVVVPRAENPNTSGKTYSLTDLNADNDGKVSEMTMREEGTLWMRIKNDPAHYKDSDGSYKVYFSTAQKVGSFTLKVMDPLLQSFKSKVQGAASSIFQRLVCYGGDSSSCINFFRYIKALLILYVMVYGAMFLLGMARINQQELVIRIIKIIIVSGLMNGSTFEFFNGYVFDAITNFSDTIISNMSGYSLFTSTNTVSNPFMFLDAVMSKIFFSTTFVAQILALLSLGLSGVIYFIIVFIAVCIVVITALRAVAVYIMAFMATCLLIGIAPLFLTFLLFDFTRYLFDNWVRFTVRYMLEPTIMMAGIIVLTQLFTIYLDFVIGYSVCWKCVLTIKSPFIGTLLPVALLNVPIFCINWFAPWGMDYMSGMMGVNMQHIIALVIISYGMYGYVEFSGDMVAKLTAGTGGPSATEMGKSMSDSAETAALSKIGMDKQTRGGIQRNAQNRLAQRNTTLDKANKGRKEISSDHNQTPS